MGRLFVLADARQENAKTHQQANTGYLMKWYNGMGKPEPLMGDLSGYWSVRIDDVNRIVFRIVNDELEIWQCGSHYRDK